MDAEAAKRPNLLISLAVWGAFPGLDPEGPVRRGCRVAEGQSGIATGLYAVVRHPMYLGLVVMMLSAPVAL